MLPYRDVDKMLGWLAAAFGFRELFRTTPEPNGNIHHAQMAVGDGAVILRGRPDYDSKWAQLIFVPVPDVDAHCERARQFGVKIIRPPRTAEFGERQYTAQDPEGHQWTFSQSVADISPEQWGALIPKQ